MVDASTLNNYAEEFRFFDDCCLALLARQYIEAALILEKGLNENRDKIQAIDQSDILQRFCARLILLKGELETAEPAEPEPQIKPLSNRKKRSQGLSCSFCGKTNDEVRKLIAGPRTYICNECVDICNEIISDDVTNKETQA